MKFSGEEIIALKAVAVERLKQGVESEAERKAFAEMAAKQEEWRQQNSTIKTMNESELNDFRINHPE